jgi:broad specificity phosphatase PhoE
MARRAAKGITLSIMRALLRTGAYKEAIEVGLAGLKHLKSIAGGDDVALAVKAVHVAGAIGGDVAAPIVAIAASGRRPALKTAAAAAARSLSPETAEPILRRLLKSRDVSVRKWAIRSVDVLGHEKLCDLLDEIQRQDPNEFIRQLAQTTRFKVLGTL